MSAPLQWWHAPEALPGIHRPQPPAPAPVRVEWMRQAPPLRAAQTAPAPRARRAGWVDAAAMFSLGVVLGCYLAAGAEWIAGVL